ncbi:MAG: hypothetical protein C0622_11555 [Desulfuromonas sp.]|nr:MAG: hypothetical protein C0622_11555 [Desulfuromonas sp.]
MQMNLTDLHQLAIDRVTRAATGENTAEDLLAELAKFWAETETALKADDSTDRSHIACCAGCDHCCVINVSILLPEGVAISRFLLGLPAAELEQISARLDDLWTRIRGLDDDERVMLRRPCAFLDDRGYCLVYPVRPLYCRSFTSTDAESCKAEIAARAHGQVLPVQAHRYQQELYETCYLGIGDGLTQVGLDGRSFQLSGLVRYLLRQPNGGADLLTAGEQLVWDDLYA